MADILYPDTLPTPQASTLTPAERRALSQADRPREARPLELDRRRFERLTFPPFDAEQAAIFRAWWRDELIGGAAWFEASWPMPEGQIAAVRKFVGAPRWEFIPGGFWRITATTEVRGRSLRPVQEEPPVAGRSIGWINPIDNPYGFWTVAHENTGGGIWAIDIGSSRFGAAVVAWDGELDTSADWTLSWAPTAADPTPFLYDSGPGSRWISVEVPVFFDFDIFNYRPSQGLLTLSATVDGVPTDEIVLSIGFGAYADVTWGPAP